MSGSGGEGGGGGGEGGGGGGSSIDGGGDGSSDADGAYVQRIDMARPLRNLSCSCRVERAVFCLQNCKIRQ